MRAMQLERLNSLAAAGNVAAEKALAGMIQAEQVRALSDRMTKVQTSKPAAEPKIGKKEEAKQAAGKISGKFAPPAQPSLLQH